jgi:23S rRNA (guanosine2251-2'-O)-methyltransferase
MFKVYVCSNPSCRMRFPATEQAAISNCPRCGDSLTLLDQPFSSPRVEPEVYPAAGPELVIVLDNLRSAFNVGSILRTADGAGVRKAYLCGVTPTPENPKVNKTGLSAEFAMDWEYHPNGVDTVLKLKNKGYPLWALEGGLDAKPLPAILDQVPERVALVAGNELAGVDPGILQLCDRIVSLPMQGFKRSLNVAVAFGIAIYFVRFSPYRTE